MRPRRKANQVQRPKDKEAALDIKVSPFLDRPKGLLESNLKMNCK